MVLMVQLHGAKEDIAGQTKAMTWQPWRKEQLQQLRFTRDIGALQARTAVCGQSVVW